MASESRAETLLFDHVAAMIGYWSSEFGNVPPETSKRDALEGLAFSLLVMLDGGALEGGTWELRFVEDDGTVGENVAGTLHELWAQRGRR